MPSPSSKPHRQGLQAGQIRDYLQAMTVQARGNLLAELERLCLLESDALKLKIVGR